MVADLQPGDVVVAERIDRLSRLPQAEAKALVATIRGTGARLSIPGVVDLSELAAAARAVLVQLGARCAGFTAKRRLKGCNSGVCWHCP